MLPLESTSQKPPSSHSFHDSRSAPQRISRIKSHQRTGGLDQESGIKTWSCGQIHVVRPTNSWDKPSINMLKPQQIHGMLTRKTASDFATAGPSTGFMFFVFSETLPTPSFWHASRSFSYPVRNVIWGQHSGRIHGLSFKIYGVVESPWIW